MNPPKEKQPLLQNQPTPKRSIRTLPDWPIIVITSSLFFLFAHHVNLFEQLMIVTRKLEFLQLDEIFVTMIGMNLVFIILLLRHGQLLKQEVEFSRETSQQVARERLLLRTVIDYLPDYIFVKDTQGRYILSNIAHARAVKSTPEALIGKKAEAVFPTDMAAQFDADDAQIMRSNHSLINAERTTIDESGTVRAVLTTKVPITDATGQMLGLVGISRDVTHRKLEQQQAVELAQERERMKMMFLFTRDAAHDFRTPLATISTSTYLLGRATDPERREYYTHNIEKAVSRLERLIEGLTHMTHLDSAETLEVRPVNVNQMIQTVATVQPHSPSRPPVPVTYDLDARLPDISASEHELRLALQNLFDNAALFTPEGGQIMLRTRQAGNEVVIEVQDTGSGISEADLPRIFDRFFRTDGARSADTGGIGLGLSITKRVIELHHGRIEVESVVNQGSTFRVYLPLP